MPVFGRRRWRQPFGSSSISVCGRRRSWPPFGPFFIGSPKSTFLLMGRFWKAALLAVVWLKLDLNNPVFEDISDASLWEAEMAAAVWVLLDLSVWTVAITAVLSGLLDISFWKVAIVCAVNDWLFLSSSGGSPKSTSPREKGDHKEPESYGYLESSYPSRQFETAYRSNPSYGSSYSALSDSTFRNRWYGEEWPYHESRALVPPYSSSREVTLSSVRIFVHLRHILTLLRLYCVRAIMKSLNRMATWNRLIRPAELNPPIGLTHLMDLHIPPHPIQPSAIAGTERSGLITNQGL
ncbi:hypothetical protein DFH08DRAFT_373978 [Mycena albidolilacea]|uniref:Uncharacterized protein n=1 Tax=Mycena albidolilacea TaxID=1033008 RepID=A0AAD7AKQ0_9AGAR|nr:hypothetical protein DFH08DRAFT_373978 [Mycena albidolilacea]